MFDLDQFVTDCLTARADPDPRGAVKDVLASALERPNEVVEVLPPRRAEIERIHVSDELTILKVVWAPGMDLYPHDHRMWASIGIYAGQEDNTFYRRDGEGLVVSGGKELTERDVVLLGDDTIHSVTNPKAGFTGAIHVYGGDFFSQPRSEWDPATLVEAPYDVDHMLETFEAANAAVAGPERAGTYTAGQEDPGRT